jgi:hypothetical protein
MTDGFFVEIIKIRRFKKDSIKGREMLWNATPVESIKGWAVSKGRTPEEAMEGQLLQYLKSCTTSSSLPILVGYKDGPMASGRMVRFIHVAG